MHVQRNFQQHPLHADIWLLLAPQIPPSSLSDDVSETSIFCQILWSLPPSTHALDLQVSFLDQLVHIAWKLPQSPSCDT